MFPEPSHGPILPYPRGEGLQNRAEASLNGKNARHAMALPNLIALLLLGPVVFRLSRFRRW